MSETETIEPAATPAQPTKPEQPALSLAALAGGRPRKPVTFLHSQKQLARSFIGIGLLGLAAEAFGLWWMAAGCILIYFALGKSLTSKQQNTEKFADSLYYMGFIMTIWALIFALQPWSSGALERLSSNTIIVQFGTALVTTALGMTLRIFLLQTRHSISDQEEDARESIAQLVTQMTTEIERSVALLKESRDRILKETEALGAEVAGQLLASGEDSRKNLAAATAALSGVVDGVAAQLLETGKRAGDAHAKAATDFAAAMRAQNDALSGAMAEVAGQIRAIALPHDVISGRIAPVAEAMAEDVTRLRATLDTASSRFADTFGQGVASVGAAMGSLSGLSDDLARVKAALADTCGAVAQAGETSRECVAANVALARGNAEASKRLADGTNEAAEAVTGLKARLEEIARTMEEVRGSAAGTLDGHVQRIGAHAGEVTSLTERVSADVRAFTKTMEEGVELLRGLADAPGGLPLQGEAAP